MVSSSYCVIVNNVLPTRSIRTGDDIKAQATGEILDHLASRYRGLPFKVQ